MNSRKAIEILNHHSILLMTTEDHDYLDALKLGIEALKRIQLGRTGVQRFAHSLLPEETEN